MEKEILRSPMHVAKWYCRQMGLSSNNDVSIRYLGQNGTWGRELEYFDTENEVRVLLKTAGEPNFELTSDEEFTREDFEG